MAEQKMTRSEMKRLAILDAAKSAFQKYGVNGTSMDELAARAKVSKRTVYNHFHSKDALVMHLMAEMWQRAQQHIHVRYDSRKPLDAQLLTMIGAEIEVMCDQEHMDLVRVAFGHFFYNPEMLQEEVNKLSRQETALFRWLRDAKEDGRLDIGDPEFASRQLHNLIKGDCFWPQVLKMEPIPDREQQRHLAEETVRMFLSYYQIP